MRYLNKIVFINSASIKYAEIGLDGNVHLTGTQGVGKSTLLRAILFFYNANKSKLGIPTAKKRFDDYYFQFQNSYILYEVMKENLPFLVLAYKVNGKVAYRFIDSGFHKELFIDETGRACESWEKIRTLLGKKIHYTKAITSYEEYRKIIYGDNKGLKPEFRKYALVESKQYQNIPRTIQNVLLNSNLEAKFIKDTIIKSISEDEFKIDLSNYSNSHLRDFDTEINDIKIWSIKNKNGRIVIRDKAHRVIENFRIFNFLKREKLDLAAALSGRIAYIHQEKPTLLSNYSYEKESLETLYNKRENLTELHRKKEQKLISEIDYVRKRLKEAKEKQAEYENQHIHSVVKAVAKEDSLYREEKTLTEEKSLLTSKFAGINQKYEALIAQIENQQKEFENEKRAEINLAENQFTNEKQALLDTCQQLVDQIKSDNQDKKAKVENELQLIVESEYRFKRINAELKHKRFFSDEITLTEKKHTELEKRIFTSKSQIQSLKREIEAIRTEWDFAKKEVEQDCTREVEKCQHTLRNHLTQVATIKQRLSERESSFYGWLNNTIPQWEESIGKVIDEEVLFKSNLSPKKSEESNTLFGVEINLNALEKRVESVEELKKEIILLNTNIAAVKDKTAVINNKKSDRIQSLKTKFGKKINALKESISECEYTLSQSERALKENRITLDEWKLKAEHKKREEFEKCEIELEQLAHRKQLAQSNLERIRKSIYRKITQKERERNQEITLAESLKEEKILEISASINKNKEDTSKRLLELREKRSKELNSEGADTERLKYIEERLSEIKFSLAYIKNNRTLVVEFQKDKRELFDKIPQFKTDKSSLENKLTSLQSDQKIELDKLNNKLTRQEDEVSGLRSHIDEFDRDLEAYHEFSKSDIFQTVQEVVISQPEQKNKNEILVTAVSLLEKIRDKHFGSIEKFRALQQSISLFCGDFNENNVFRFKLKFNTDKDYFTFAEELKEFIEEDKISEFEKRVNERFAHIIHLIGTETAELISKEAEIEKIIKKINADFMHKNFVEAIKQMEMRTEESSNPVVRLLVKIKEFSEENYLELGENNLFSSSDSSDKNRKAVELLKQLLKELDRYKNPYLTLSESFDLQFKIVENDNDSGWVEKLSNVGSEGTDVLVKAMVNILLLNVFKENASKKFKDFKLHCMMDEIGRLHPTNVKGILRFANERNILLINGSPTSQNAIDYKYTYKLSKVQSEEDKTKYITRITRLVKVIQQVQQ